MMLLFKGKASGKQLSVHNRNSFHSRNLLLGYTQDWPNIKMEKICFYNLTSEDGMLLNLT